MYIIPDSTLYILRNVPLDTTYDHTLWFNKADAQDIDEGKRAQAAYFASLAKYRLEYERGNALTYIRVNRGTIKVPYKADDLYDCNYIMFRNRSFGTKWFYAFIRSIEYVNNTTTEITFDLDVMQTWHFDYQIDECFVEREHSVTDVPGENTLPENVAIGDYVSEEYTPITKTDGSPLFGSGTWSIVLARSSKADILNVPTLGGWYGGDMYSQIEYDVYENNGTGRANLERTLTNLSIFNNTEVVVRIFMCPTELIVPLQNHTEITPLKGTNFITRPTSIGSYTNIKNKKLLTFPYVCCTLTNLQGQTVDLHYEYSYYLDGFIYLDWQMSFGLKPEFVVTPSQYLVEQGLASEYRITLSDFPDVPYATTDLYAKLVQKSIGIALGALAGNPASITTKTTNFAGGSVAKNKSGKPIKSTESSFTKREQSVTSQKTPVSREVGDMVSDAVFNGRMNTSIGDSNALANLGRFGVYVLKNHIREEYARVIDDYFSAFGYATKRLKHPNCSSRPHWNYVKTIGCTITGSVPCDDMAAICSIYDTGITFWKNGAEVGNYSLDNSPS